MKFILEAQEDKEPVEKEDNKTDNSNIENTFDGKIFNREIFN